MCGRLYILTETLGRQVKDNLGLDLNLDLDLPQQTELELRPSERVNNIISQDGKLRVQQSRWGIKPSWANRLLINAQAETVSEKRTFAQAFRQHRCLIPCSGWFEWRDEGGAKKHKYLFSHRQQQPFYMAGIYYPSASDVTELLTLTTCANQRCAPYHNRMPLLITAEQISYWFNASVEELTPLLHCIDHQDIQVTGVA